jgi:L-fuconolactonase
MTDAWPLPGEVTETAIDPLQPIVDPHHHLWELEGSRYLSDEFIADIRSGHNIIATVYVECGSGYRTGGPKSLQAVGETEFALREAAKVGGTHRGSTRLCAGIVPFADLTLGAGVRDVLEAHQAASANRLRGIRHRLAWAPIPELLATYPHPPPGLMGDTKFREGFAQLEALGLSFDAWVYHPQIPELTELVRAFPNTSFILDHFGGPLGIGSHQGREDDVFAQWRTSIDALAAYPNVVAKIGGINMAINGFDWHKRATLPGSAELAQATSRYYLHTIERFGPSRCMFESNFPVDKVSCSYVVLWNAFKRIAAPLSASEKALLFHDTAKRVYRLDI